MVFVERVEIEELSRPSRACQATTDRRRPDVTLYLPSSDGPRRMVRPHSVKLRNDANVNVLICRSERERPTPAGRSRATDRAASPARRESAALALSALGATLGQWLVSSSCLRRERGSRRREPAPRGSGPPPRSGAHAPIGPRPTLGPNLVQNSIHRSLRLCVDVGPRRLGHRPAHRPRPRGERGRGTVGPQAPAADAPHDA